MGPLVSPAVSRRLSRFFWGVVVTVVALLMVSPLVWMVSTSFKPESEVLPTAGPGGKLPPPRWIPENPTTENYQELFRRTEEAPMLRWIINSIGISLTTTFLVLAVTSMAAFAFARLHFKGRDALFLVVVATMAVPGAVTLIPVFLIVQKLGWFDTYAGLIVPGLASAFGVFLLRQFFLAVPAELEEAAFLDGAGIFRVFWSVVLPLAKPALATLAIFTFMGSWNAFEWPLIVTNDVNMRTLPIGLAIFQGRYTSENALTMAAAVVTTIPMLIAFMIFQRRITEGIALTGIKG